MIKEINWSFALNSYKQIFNFRPSTVLISRIYMPY